MLFFFFQNQDKYFKKYYLLFQLFSSMQIMHHDSEPSNQYLNSNLFQSISVQSLSGVPEWKDTHRENP